MLEKTPGSVLNSTGYFPSGWGTSIEISKWDCQNNKWNMTYFLWSCMSQIAALQTLGKLEMGILRDNWSNSNLQEQSNSVKGKRSTESTKPRKENLWTWKVGEMLKAEQAVLEKGVDVLLVLDMGWTCWLGA